MASTSSVQDRADHAARAERASIEAVIRRLVDQFPELPPEQIEQRVRGEYDGYEASKVRDFVPVLVERSVRAELGRR